MSWFSDIAGKAEDFLNKIDQNAAVVLKGDGLVSKKSKKKEESLEQDHRIEIPRDVDLVEESVNSHSPNTLKLSYSSPSLPFSGSPSNTSTSFYPDLLGSVRHDKADMSTSPDSNSIKLNITEDMRELLTENQLLKNEVRSLNDEISHLLNRVRESNQDSNNLEEKVAQTEAETDLLNKELNDVVHKMSELEKKCHTLHLENDRLHSDINKDSTQLKDSERELFEASKKEEVLNSNLLQLENKLSESEKRASMEEEGRQKLEVELEEVRHELEVYRARAQRTLAEKHKLIEELTCAQAQAQPAVPQIRIDEWLVECDSLREQLEMSQLETRKVEEKLEAAKRESSRIETEATEYKEISLSKYQAISQELECVRGELGGQVVALEERLKEREAEVRTARLEAAAAGRRARGTTHETFEGRLANLTSALVRKQAALEQVTAEAAQLRLQLETARNKWRESIQPQIINVNDTDDVKAQVPLLGSRFESGMTRRVNQLYMAIDCVAGTATAYFLRRVPMARLIIVFYLIMIHLIVCLVLYSWTPDTK